MKRGQITIYVIIGIVIVVSAFAVIYTQQTKRQAELNREFFARSDIKPSIVSIQASLIDCTKDATRDSLDVIGIQGGYYDKPKNYLDLEWAIIPFYYNEGEIIRPSKQQVEQELGKFIDRQLQYCFEEINSEGFNLTYNKPVTKAMIKNKEVSFNIELPVVIEKEGHTLTYELKDYPISHDSELNSMINLAHYFTDSHKQDPELYCISCIGEIAEKDDLYVDVINIGDKTTLVVISENHTSPEPYSFEFLNKYSGNEKSPEITPTENIPRVPGV